jgi:predicted transcriptional regulator
MIPRSPSLSKAITDQNVICEECDKEFRTKWDLVVHYRSEHSMTTKEATALACKFAGPPGT